MTDTPDILAGLVKPLVWRKDAADARRWVSGPYHIVKTLTPLDKFHVCRGAKSPLCETLEAAQAAANAAHAACVLASIDVDKLRALVEALGPCIKMLKELVAESGRSVEWGEEDAFRMGEWFEKDDLEAIENARAALAALTARGKVNNANALPKA